MKILVTGGMGVIGTAIIRGLLASVQQGVRHEVTIFDRRPGRYRVPGVRSIVGDHGDLAALTQAAKGADAVLHLSANHPAPGDNTAAIFRENVVGVHNVHEAARRQGVRRVVHWSSVATLGWSGENEAFMPDYLPIDEDHPLRATDPYGLSKVVGEDIAHSFSIKHGLETIALRHVFTLTPETGFDYLKRGGKRHGRWIHYAYVDIRDTAPAVLRALEIEAPGHIALFVAADDSCVAEPLSEFLPTLRPEVAERAAGLTGTQSAISNARAKTVLGWQPRYTWRTPPSMPDRARFLAGRVARRIWMRVPDRVRPTLKRVLLRR